jgi:hypothetical protein
MLVSMLERDVLEVLDILDADEVTSWLDGGWGVDALLGVQTRPHADLDLAVPREHVAQVVAGLRGQGFLIDETAVPGLPARVVLRAADGRQVDVHPLVMDERGDGWQELGGGSWAAYPAEGLRGRGSIADRAVACTTPQLQLDHHRGYEWDEADRCDMERLAHRFALDLAADEEPLHGGNTHTEVVRIGGTVRRPVGRWTPGVHALLRHFEARGFDGAPRVVGLDSQGRESLTFVAGSVVWPDHFDLVASDSALAQVATLIRTYHRIAADFPAPDRFQWSDRGLDPSGQREILCHNDLAPWNLVLRSGGTWAFIDWDTAGPGRLAWDVSWALMSFVPLWPDSGIGPEETLHRISVFADAYGRSGVPRDVIPVAVERCRHEAESIERRGVAGEAPYAKLLAEGHAEAWHGTAAHIDTHAPAWVAALGAG